MDKKQKFCDLLGRWVESSSVPCLVAQSCPTVCNPTDCSPPGSSVHGDSPGKNIGVGCHAFLQGIFPTKGLNPRLPHCRQILYHLSHQGSPKILELIPIPSPKDLSDPGIKLGSPSLQVDSLPVKLLEVKWSESRSIMSDSLGPHGL